jgi:iron complex outermembrane receptor protein
VGVDYSWRDRIYFTEFNTSDAQQDAYGKLDLSASLRSEDSGWRLYGFVRNATDESAIGSMAIVSPLLGSVRVVNLIPPRHFGIGLDVSF